MSSQTLLNPEIFTSLNDRIEEETAVRETLTQIIQRLERAVATAQALLSRVHGTPRARYPALIEQVEAAIGEQREIIGELSKTASNHPYYKYNSKWSRTVQSAITTAIYTAWLGGFPLDTSPARLGRLASLEDIGKIYQVPTNLKDKDAFHITIEEYLLALTDFTSDLSRLAINSVTMGDFELPLVISTFIKDLFAGFQVLNLKNDILRKRADAVKYDVKRVEDVVYDLSLRGLVKRPTDADTEMKTGA
ncbi:Translin [Emericellopsis atlantica]|uniref:Translin n=1 Tax=Emericellopsis atlantica TaxID=2614577 RepID=A0A9P7ZP83_9HYPO|nr:Translin [Emericellopsis atlantica]KAG9255754.1 Translin [Emericellopsis atlantica]